MARKPKLGLPLQTLRNAPDALEGRRLRGGVFEIDPDHIETAGRLDDRLQIEIEGLKASIFKNGQRVPILVRPLESDRYSLIYGRRRLEACRELAALLEGDHLGESERTNKGVAEVLNLTEAGVSQLLSVVRTVGEDLVLAIGAAPGIGRPRWEELKKCLGAADVDHERLATLANETKSIHSGGIDEKSDRAFLAVLSAAGKTEHSTSSTRSRGQPGMVIPGVGAATVTTGRRGKQLKLELKSEDTEFVSWLEGNAPQLLTELHERYKRSED